ncbi:C1 family peptidase [Peptostreptococcaceae bacterium AGR-M142]
MKRNISLIVSILFIISSSFSFANVDLPSKYDLRELNRVTKAKHQGNNGSCWAFASMSALESTLLNLDGQEYDFSENNLDMNHGFDLAPRTGGLRNFTTAYMTRWDGPILDIDDPYEKDLNAQDVRYANKITDADVKKHVQDIMFLEDKEYYYTNDLMDLNDTKNAIMEYGGVVSGMHIAKCEKGSPTYKNDEVYNQDTYSYFSNDYSNKVNHDIVIIGWDDSYSVDNFNQKPDSNGAWICENNWGKEFGEAGYFYISYESAGLLMNQYVFTNIEDVDNYDNIYQYDYLGNTKSTRSDFWMNSDFGNKDLYFNVFDANEESEMLKALGFYTLGKNAKYELYFISDFENFKSRINNDGEYFEDIINEFKIEDGEIENAGFHTISVNGDYIINPNKKFGVGLYVDVEASDEDFCFEKSNMQVYSSKAKVNKGETYYYDPDCYEITDANMGYQGFGNLCLKAYTDILVK